MQVEQQIAVVAPLQRTQDAAVSAAGGLERRPGFGRGRIGVDLGRRQQRPGTRSQAVGQVEGVGQQVQIVQRDRIF